MSDTPLTPSSPSTMPPSVVPTPTDPAKDTGTVASKSLDDVLANLEREVTQLTAEQKAASAAAPTTPSTTPSTPAMSSTMPSSPVTPSHPASSSMEMPSNMPVSPMKPVAVMPASATPLKPAFGAAFTEHPVGAPAPTMPEAKPMMPAHTQVVGPAPTMPKITNQKPMTSLDETKAAPSPTTPASAPPSGKGRRVSGKLIAGIVGLLILIVGTLVTLTLLPKGAEIRQQASNGTSCFGTSKSDCENVGGCSWTDGPACAFGGGGTASSNCPAGCYFLVEIPQSCTGANPACATQPDAPACVTLGCTFTNHRAASCTGNQPGSCGGSPTAPSCAAAGASCESQSCCSGLSCQGAAGSRKCEQPPSNFCGDGGTCSEYDGFQCSDLASDGTCTQNKRTFSDWAGATGYASANKCGQADVVCVGGPKAGAQCGDFAIYKDSCGVTPPPPPPSSTVPDCGGLTLASGDPNNLVVGQQYTFKVTTAGTAPITNVWAFVHKPTDCIGVNPSNRVDTTTQGTYNITWTPTVAGSYVVSGRIWNDGIAEGRADCVDGPPRFLFANANACKLNLTVKAPAAKTYTIHTQPVCAGVAVTNKPTVLLHAIWPPNPLNFIKDTAANGVHTVTVNPTDSSSSLYFELTTDGTDATAMHATSITPTPPAGSADMSTFFNPPTQMVRFFQTAPSGTYTINYDAPAAWCATPPSCIGITTSFGATVPKAGDSVFFTCSPVALATKYEFRYAIGLDQGGIWQSLTPSAAKINQSSPLIISNPNKYTVQCRPCVGALCANWSVAN